VIEIKGISASPGIAIGKVYLFTEAEQKVPEYSILDSEVYHEMDRYKKAVSRSIHDLEGQKTNAGKEQSYLETHILMLQDPEVHAKIEHKLTRNKKNVESVLSEVIGELIFQLESLEDLYLRERVLDVKDVSRRILGHLLKTEDIGIKQLREEVILVCHNLMPSDAVAMDKTKVLGIALDAGGRTTHTAILARSYEIPAVLGTGRITKAVKDGDMLIVDGVAGLVIVNPDPDTLRKYAALKAEYQAGQNELQHISHVPCVTKDGHFIQLKANIENPSEVASVLLHGAEGIGLYRSEFLYIQHGVDVSEDVQFEAYKTVLEGMGEKPVTIRTLDLGGDKLSTDWSGPREANPILGWRAIRFCLSRLDVFRKQLRALLRSSVYGNLRIMFPLISSVNEFQQALDFYTEVQEELRREGIPFRDKIPLGTMIEVPSAVMVADHLAKMADFFSIGTNDLIQYTLAVDRGNEKIADFYDPYHPGVLRMIEKTVQAAKMEGISVSVCGEMAGDPSMSLILLGLGIEEFSMSPIVIPQVKNCLRSFDLFESIKVVNEVLKLPTSKQVSQYVTENGPGICFDPS